jgi:hypothetical protein
MNEEIVLVEKPISKEQLKQIAEQRFGDMTKAVVDIEKGVMTLGGDLHADEEAIMLEQGSEQKNLWGINLYPELTMPDYIEFDSMINIRPSQNNRSRSVEDEGIRKKIIDIVNKLVI